MDSDSHQIDSDEESRLLQPYTKPSLRVQTIMFRHVDPMPTSTETAGGASI